MKRTKNDQLSELIVKLKTMAIEKKVNLWKRVAVDLEKPSRSRRIVNVYKIDSTVKDGEFVVVPGKVLGNGDISKPVTVAALSFSDEAVKKILSAKGKVLTLGDALAQNPQGKNVRIIG